MLAVLIYLLFLKSNVYSPPRHQDQDTGIRVGDVFALMIEHWYEQRNAAQAYKLVEQMRSRNIILSPYLDQRMIEDIYKVIDHEGENEGMRRAE